MSDITDDHISSTQGMSISRGSVWMRSFVELLSSMRFAIALLTLICIASIIGTVLKQHEPLNNYINQFGPFWAQVFAAVDLYTVYSAWWFLLILAFLVTSTSLCIARNTPKIMAGYKDLKENIREQSLKAFGHKASAGLEGSTEDNARRIGGQLAKQGWKVKLQKREAAGHAGWMVAAKTGSANKIGYIAAHSAIVLVCLGGLLDGDLIVRAQTWFGGKQTYTGGGMIKDIPAQHRLSQANPTFRGNILVAEGTQSATAILNQPSGVLLQELPFSIELKKFVVEHYSTGMPKLFASDIVIHDKETGQAIPARVEVNHPVNHRGVEIYQSSFDDGGSTVKLKAMALNAETKAFEISGVIGDSKEITNGKEKLTIEFNALRVMNVENFGKEGAGATDVRAVDLGQALDKKLGAANKTKENKALRNVGPSITYRLRDAAGQANEFHNYMLPIDMDGSQVFLLGMRTNLNDRFSYLRVPADEKGSMESFVALNAGLRDPAMRQAAVARYVKQAIPADKPQLAAALASSASRALDLFAGAGQSKNRGLQALGEFMEQSVPEAERAKASDVLVRILNGVLFELAQISRDKAGLPAMPANEKTQAFMTSAVLALSEVHLYPAPMAFMLSDFQQLQASVFQVARAPGKNIVYLGCLLLILGVFAMLYVRERRLWVWLAEPTAPADTLSAGNVKVQASMALSCNRQMMDTDKEFAKLKQQLLGLS
ncbi:MAG: hypothetical protein RLZZ271_1111 [Pseudomonadota bacterium]|jgi:cytochrome c biogenesis protein